MGKRLDGSSLFGGFNANLSNTFAQLNGHFEDGLTVNNLNQAVTNPELVKNINSTFASYMNSNFNNLDENADGKISPEEIQKFMNNVATQGLTREQIYSLAASTGMNSSLQDTVLSHFDEIDKNKDGKVSNQEINAYGVTSDIEKRKIADMNRMVNNMSMFYSDDIKEHKASIMDYKYLSDEGN